MKEERKRGRPPKLIEKVRDNILKVRLTKEELHELQLVSIFLNENLSETVRKVIHERYYDLFGG